MFVVKKQKNKAKFEQSNNESADYHDNTDKNILSFFNITFTFRWSYLCFDMKFATLTNTSRKYRIQINNNNLLNAQFNFH